MSKIFIPVYLILIVISVSAVQFESFEVVRPEIEQLESDNNVFDYKFLPRPEEGLRDKRRLVVGMPNLLFMKEREPEPQLQRPSTRKFEMRIPSFLFFHSLNKYPRRINTA